MNGVINETICVGIIDDDAFYTAIMIKQLERADIKVQFNALDGFCGIAILQSTLILPNVVIIDLEMPLMNGFDVVKNLKQAWPWLQIIAHSSITSEAVHKQVIADGADIFVLKDGDGLKLIKAIKKLAIL
ncbi:PleD family two-component system response regulator [Mucilaginibacter ximonensis]|uniref:PleD family two-component system response regulator n=1 Tax=Mucilaginibacter ximonensis TaxID=538021 RepID=A0ABW5YDW6_9SPHI